MFFIEPSQRRTALGQQPTCYLRSFGWQLCDAQESFNGRDVENPASGVGAQANSGHWRLLIRSGNRRSHDLQ